MGHVSAIGTPGSPGSLVSGPEPHWGRIKVRLLISKQMFDRAVGENRTLVRHTLLSFSPEISARQLKTVETVELYNQVHLLSVPPDYKLEE